MTDFTVSDGEKARCFPHCKVTQMALHDGEVLGRLSVAFWGEWTSARPAASSARVFSAWNKDPVFGVIGIQSGPRG